MAVLLIIALHHSNWRSRLCIIAHCRLQMDFRENWLSIVNFQQWYFVVLCGIVIHDANPHADCWKLEFFLCQSISWTLRYARPCPDPQARSQLSSLDCSSCLRPPFPTALFLSPISIRWQPSSSTRGHITLIPSLKFPFLEPSLLYNSRS
jgi:hypothetical protein